MQRKRNVGNLFVKCILGGICIVCVTGWCKSLAEVAQQEEMITSLQQENVSLEEQVESMQEEIEVLTNPGNGVRAYGQLSVKNGKLLSESGEPVTLRGMSSHGLNWYPKYTNAAAMSTLKEYGANVFRIAMYTDQNGGYIYENQQNETYMYMAIENVLSQDMYAIVDWHVLRDENPLLYADEAVSFFEQISAHYAGNKGIIYEICNEPNGSTTWEDIREYANRVIPVIRANSPEAVIIVGTPDYCTELSEAVQRPLEYDNIMYAYHKYIDVSKDKELENGRLKEAIEAEFPVFVSEWGISYGDRDDTNIDSYKDESLYPEQAYEFVEYMDKHDISWCGWSLSNKAEAHSMILSDCDKLSGWTKEDMTPGGWFMMQSMMESEEQ